MFETVIIMSKHGSVAICLNQDLSGKTFFCQRDKIGTIVRVSTCQEGTSVL